MKTFFLNARAGGPITVVVLTLASLLLAACDKMQGVRQPSEYESQQEIARGGGDY